MSTSTAYYVCEAGREGRKEERGVSKGERGREKGRERARERKGGRDKEARFIDII